MLVWVVVSVGATSREDSVYADFRVSVLQFCVNDNNSNPFCFALDEDREVILETEIGCLVRLLPAAGGKQ